MSEQRYVVVGVDGGEGGLRAAEYAGMLARTHDMSVHLVHALSLARGSTAFGLSRECAESPRAFGEAAVRNAAQRIAQTSPGVCVDWTVALGDASTLLVNASRKASCVIVGHRPLHRHERVMPCSTIASVAVRSSAPVVCVPLLWGGSNVEESREVVAPIVVGVDASAHGRAAVAFAFEEAARAHCSVQAVRVVPRTRPWRPGSPYEDASTGTEWIQDGEVLLSEILAGYGDRYPEVPVIRIVDSTSPIGSTLARRGVHARLLVVGTRGGWGLGMVVREVLAGASVPVAVVHRTGGDMHRPSPSTAWAALTTRASGKKLETIDAGGTP
jgi:nucleotide-binding universal stress UspA family protein